MRVNKKSVVISSVLAALLVALTGCKGGNATANKNADLNKTSANMMDGYQLVWYDEFDAAELDGTKWNTSQTRMKDSDELAQSNASYVRTVASGNLKLIADLNPWYDPTSEKYFEQHKYMTTTSVTTENRMSFRYGYLEMRAKVPFKEGCWPSLWLRSHHATEKSNSSNYDIEIDIFEVFGSTNRLAANLHQQMYNGISGNSFQTGGTKIDSAEIFTFANAENLSNEYHVYGFEWTPEKISIYVDRQLVCEWKIDKNSFLSYGLQPDISGMDNTVNILLNNHLFTKTTEYIPSANNIIENYESNLPAVYEIDYIRLYQKNDDVSKLIVEK